MRIKQRTGYLNQNHVSSQHHCVSLRHAYIPCFSRHASQIAPFKQPIAYNYTLKHWPCISLSKQQWRQQQLIDALKVAASAPPHFTLQQAPATTKSRFSGRHASSWINLQAFVLSAAAATARRSRDTFILTHCSSFLGPTVVYDERITMQYVPQIHIYMNPR